MKLGTFWWLGGVIAAQSERRMLRPRLQPTIKLLQSLGLPTDYLFTTFFHGLYSEGIHWDVRLLQHLGLLRFDAETDKLEATVEAAMPEVQPFTSWLQQLESIDDTILEIAAAYEALRERGATHEQAWNRLRRMQAGTGEETDLHAALILLHQLGLYQTPRRQSAAS